MPIPIATSGAGARGSQRSTPNSAPMATSPTASVAADVWGRL